MVLVAFATTFAAAFTTAFTAAFTTGIPCAAITFTAIIITATIMVAIIIAGSIHTGTRAGSGIPAHGCNLCRGRGGHSWIGFSDNRLR